MEKNQGFILMAVLIFLQIYSLLGLAALERVFLAEKENADQHARRFLLNDAEKWRQRLAVTFDESQLACLIPHTAPQDLRVRPLTWWSLFSCSIGGGGLRSYYVVEALGSDPCAQPQALAYYRLTLRVSKENNDSIKVILQGTVAKPISSFEHCDSEHHSVDWGSQVWIEI